jgi:nitrate reductase NapE component
MRQDDQAEIKSSERMIRWALVAVISVFLFSCLYLGVKFLE